MRKWLLVLEIALAAVLVAGLATVLDLEPALELLWALPRVVTWPLAASTAPIPAAAFAWVELSTLYPKLPGQLHRNIAIGKAKQGKTTWHDAIAIEAQQAPAFCCGEWCLYR